MNIFQKDEILVKYANSLKEVELQKIAWDWVDIGNALGLDALLGAGLGAGGAALTGTGIGAGILGGLGIASGIVPAVLAAAGVVYTVYNVMQHADDNVDDLIERLDALDPNKYAKPVVDKWIEDLKQFTNVFNMQVKSQDPTERAGQISAQIQGINNLLIYLKGMSDQWAEVKRNLTDWGVDGQQAETALNKTIQAAQSGLSAIKQSSQQEGAKLVQQLGKQTGLDYSAIAKQIVNFHNQIIQLDGNPPEYEEYEKPVFQLAQDILEGKAALQDINELVPQMRGLAKGLQSALFRAQKKNKKRSSLKNISKRAVRLSSEVSAPQTAKNVAPVKTKNKSESVSITVGKDPKVQSLQKSLNYLNLNLKTGIGRIAEDGDYGQNTINALVALLEKVPVIETYLARGAGLDKESISNSEFIKQNPEYLNGLVNIIVGLANKIRPKAEAPEIETQYTGQAQCREDKENPKPEEILACLKARQVRDPQTEQYSTAYEYLKTKGMRDNDIVALIVRLFGGARSEDWSMPLIVKYVSGPRFDVLRGY